MFTGLGYIALVLYWASSKVFKSPYANAVAIWLKKKCEIAKLVKAKLDVLRQCLCYFKTILVISLVCYYSLAVKNIKQI